MSVMSASITKKSWSGYSAGQGNPLRQERRGQDTNHTLIEAITEALDNDIYGIKIQWDKPKKYNETEEDHDEDNREDRDFNSRLKEILFSTFEFYEPDAKIEPTALLMSSDSVADQLLNQLKKCFWPQWNVWDHIGPIIRKITHEKISKYKCVCKGTYQLPCESIINNKPWIISAIDHDVIVCFYTPTKRDHDWPYYWPKTVKVEISCNPEKWVSKWEADGESIAWIYPDPRCDEKIIEFDVEDGYRVQAVATVNDYFFGWFRPEYVSYNTESTRVK